MCRKIGATSFGCDYSGGANGRRYFYPCTDCECYAPDHSCPETAKGNRGDNGDCECGVGTYCYEGDNINAGCISNARIAYREANRGATLNDTRFFRHSCTSCRCEPQSYRQRVSDQESCNVESISCLASDSNFVGLTCSDDDWTRCCNRDEFGCARRCCGMMPAWLVALTVIMVLIAVAICGGLCYFCHEKEQKRMRLIHPEWAEEPRPPIVTLAPGVADEAGQGYSGDYYAQQRLAMGGYEHGVVRGRLPPLRGAAPEPRPQRPKSAASQRFAGVL